MKGPNQALAFRSRVDCEADVVNYDSTKIYPIFPEDELAKKTAIGWANIFNDYTKQKKSYTGIKSFCYIITGCKEYTDNLKCKTCFEGYYLNKK